MNVQDVQHIHAKSTEELARLFVYPPDLHTGSLRSRPQSALITEPRSRPVP